MVTNVSKNTSSVHGQNRMGAKWRYEKYDLTYEMAILYYNSYGPVTIITNVSKNTSIITNQTKN